MLFCSLLCGFVFTSVCFVWIRARNVTNEVRNNTLWTSSRSRRTRTKPRSKRWRHSSMTSMSFTTVTCTSISSTFYCLRVTVYKRWRNDCVNSDYFFGFSLHFFTDYALLSLHDGIFMLQSHAEGYLSMFTSRLRIFDKKGQQRQPLPGIGVCVCVLRRSSS